MLLLHNGLELERKGCYLVENDNYAIICQVKY